MKTPEGPSKSCKLSLHDRLLSILKSLKSDIAESFQQVSWKDLQHCEDFVEEICVKYGF